VVSVVCTGLIAGVLLGDRVGAAHARPKLSASGFVQFQQIVHDYFVIMMPFLLAGSILGGLVWLALLRSRWRAPEFWLAALATVTILGILVLTRAVNVPINEQLMTWSIEAPPANVRALWAPWEQAHTVRTIAAIGAFLAQVIALGIFRSNEI
jgi:uncharacterized membrane protein